MSSRQIRKTSSAVVIKRAAVIFSSLILLIIVAATVAVYSGVKSGEIQRRFLQPLERKIAEIWKVLTEPPKRENLLLPSPSTATPSATTTPPRFYQHYEYKVEPTVIYRYPTYSYPTPIPGRPGSKEWDEEFWKKWDETGKRNAEMQKQVEENQKKFCEQNADLCNR